MGLRTILVNDIDTLHKKSRKIEAFDDRLFMLLDDIKETLYSKENAVGLAAPQIGVLRCLAVIDVGYGAIELINPVVVESHGEAVCDEGCLSFPGVFKSVKRPEFVRVKNFNRKGEEVFLEGRGLLARALCHEIDHLNGIVFLDRASEIL